MNEIPTVETRVIGGLVFKSLQDEEEREYVFDRDNCVHIKNPLWLYVNPANNSHRIVTKTHSFYIPSGWLFMAFKPKPGTDPFSF